MGMLRFAYARIVLHGAEESRPHIEEDDTSQLVPLPWLPSGPHSSPLGIHFLIRYNQVAYVEA